MDGATGFAMTALVNIVISLACIALCWWVLQNLRLDVFIRNSQGAKGKALLIILSIVLGHGLATFIIDYTSWSRILPQLVG
ncbi:conserved hypothetical integral membrane protein [Marininema mesophilum]|uniref:Conserved hypothetical integral membrane protein n=1 Tax=Marininema mesophilum TaxID=1048340 RepID=A0A1H2TE73_9BACL|nr:DUF1146 family protein [Marininema mesophilum]SDW42067.1 conserved hypothetical integral membrane protein [Marininema mesophilum]